MAAVRIA